MNSEPLRVLSLEADAGDFEQVKRHAEVAGMPFAFERAASKAEFEGALKRGNIDLILADHCMPGFDGLDALAAASLMAPGTPYIIVSRSIGEDRAVESVKLGAWDFVHKDRLGRLPESITACMRSPRYGAAGDGAEVDPADFAERRKAQTELLQAQKMELVGKLAGGIAHDFNNLLTIISGYVSMLLDKETLQPRSLEALKRVFTASRQATALVRQLLLFSRKRSPKPELVDLNAEAEVMAEMLRRLLSEHMVIEFEAAPVAPWVKVDVSMLEQVLMNLAFNARDAMPKEGTLKLSVGIRPASDGSDAQPARGEQAFIAMRDTGHGIPPEVLPRIFEPFFTTKQDGRGTGLGLATAMDIVRRHDGSIEVETEVGVGAVFRIYLPTTKPEQAEAEAAGATKAARSTKGTILLVEDETNVREFAAAVLQQDGYTLLQAKSAESALEVWHWHNARIGLLLSDVVLPGELSGVDLGRALQEERPQLKVLLTTGYNRETVAPYGKTLPVSVLNKPYTPRALLQAVREAFER